MKILPKRSFIITVLCACFTCAPVAHCQGFFGKLKNKITSSVSPKKNQKNTNSDIDIMELSLDDNITLPQVPEKQHEIVVKHMNALAKRLAKRKKERIETMRDGEVVVATLRTELLFAPNDTVLNNRAQEFLQPYVDLLNQRGMYKMVIVVHTDNTGSDTYTDNLSVARVNAVFDWMSARTESESLVPYGMGAAEPLRPNKSYADRSANRRLEIYIIPDSLALDMAKSQLLTY